MTRSRQLNASLDLPQDAGAMPSGGVAAKSLGASAKGRARQTAAARPGESVIRIGFVALIDAAPLIVAHEMGYFSRNGVRVALEKQIGWANIRDKLIYGHLDAGHSLLGMPLSHALEPDASGAQVISVMELGTGGNAITLSRRLVDRGVRSAATLARWLNEQKAVARAGDVGRKLTLAHVFGCSMHHYLLREWLSAAGIDADLDINLCVLPPSQMVEHLRQTHLDGFCVGEPWNTLAEQTGCGMVVAPTADILPNHPEKVLAVTQKWANAHPASVVAVIKALLKACTWCSDVKNHPSLAEMLASDRYLGLPTETLAASLRVDRTVGVAPRTASPRPIGWQMRSFAVGSTYPLATHSAWLGEQMVRWGHVSINADVVSAATDCTEPSFYRKAAAELGLTVPNDELAPMALKHGGSYEPRRSAALVGWGGVSAENSSRVPQPVH